MDVKTGELNLRDPYVLLHDGIYYLYGTRSATCWGPADGFDGYRSRDLEHWEGPFEVFHRPAGFFADRNYWAPECCFDGDGFCLIATLASEHRKKGIYLLRADHPLGPFHPVGEEPLTPPEWTCIDGSLFRDENGVPWLIFSHSFEDTPEGDMCAVRLRDDLSQAASEPVTLFRAADAPWATPVPFAKAEFGMDGDVYFTDGPCVHRMEDGSLSMLWSSWSGRGYAVGVASSASGSMLGPWKHQAEPLFPENGGHGMLFRTGEGRLTYVLHAPNDKYLERPVFRTVLETDGLLRLE